MKMHQIGCGGCGSLDLTLFASENLGFIEIRCLGCETRSNIVIEAPKLEIAWGRTGNGKDSPGRHTLYDEEKNFIMKTRLKK